VSTGQLAPQPISFPLHWVSGAACPHVCLSTPVWPAAYNAVAGFNDTDWMR
jgi:hypothetical protein